MANNNETKPGQIQVNMQPEVEKGVYSNLVIMSNTDTEFIFDFTFKHPAVQRATVGARVQMHPAHAKRLLNLLAQNIRNYEQHFGEIELSEPTPPQPKGPISPFKLN